MWNPEYEAEAVNDPRLAFMFLPSPAPPEGRPSVPAGPWGRGIEPVGVTAPAGLAAPPHWAYPHAPRPHVYLDGNRAERFYAVWEAQ